MVETGRLQTKYLDDLMAARSYDDVKNARGAKSQRGAGEYTLCIPCNNKTGSWYGRDYVHWAYQALRLARRAEIAPSLYHTFHFFPLRVLKQIACMFFSANPPGFQSAQKELVRFVLDRERRHIDPGVRLYAYYNLSPWSRQSAVSGLVTFGEGTKVFSEIAFPPLGYILSLSGKPVHESLCDISFFSRYSYNTWTDVPLRLAVLPVETVLPGDFRPASEVFCVRRMGMWSKSVAASNAPISNK